MTVRHTCLPCCCTPAWQRGVPNRHTGVHQHGGQVSLTVMLVYTSSASRCDVSTDTGLRDQLNGGQGSLEPLLVAGQLYLPTRLESVDRSTDTGLCHRDQPNGYSPLSWLLGDCIHHQASVRRRVYRHWLGDQPNSGQGSLEPLLVPPTRLVSVDVSMDTGLW
ncbi:hypothetical protein PCASD_15915 [Puccinia coronata f. sp. avenae]|uniref:Uncharacterized protein n=1 Tax=Puccinia coronata f. sp. avenae TaxID=200324 RepID=A0A2N5UEY3_9BASI|nr:hypothetical protein PCASD_15915 [Puccinia coronata f. sp. avenae]